MALDPTEELLKIDVVKAASKRVEALDEGLYYLNGDRDAAEEAFNNIRAKEQQLLKTKLQWGKLKLRLD